MTKRISLLPLALGLGLTLAGCDTVSDAATGAADATTSADKKISVASAGIGVRATLPSKTQAGAYVAVPLNRDVAAEGKPVPVLTFGSGRLALSLLVASAAIVYFVVRLGG